MRRLFTPIALPTLSAAGARAGLGPDGPTGKDRPQTDGVDTRPDPRLDRPIASRLPDDISEAAQMAQAERMGVHVPVEAPTLSANGKNAGLGTFAASSSSPGAVRNASMRDLAMARSKVAAAGRKATAMVSRPVAPISETSGKRGITGSKPIAAKDKGFEMRVPKGPVAQDRERWKSGTEDRIAGASKGLSLANMDWGDHRGAAPKSQPKRTWVGKQGDATENPYDKATCADLAVAPHPAVNKTAPLRELEKETVPSDVCPPLKSSTGSLEAMLSRDAELLAKSPEELLRVWANRPAPMRGGAMLVHGMGSLRPAAAAMNAFSKGPMTGKSCGCSDCGCDKKPKPAFTTAGVGYVGPASSSARRYSATRRFSSAISPMGFDGVARMSDASRMESMSGGLAGSGGAQTAGRAPWMNFSVTNDGGFVAGPFQTAPIVALHQHDGLSPSGRRTSAAVAGRFGSVVSGFVPDAGAPETGLVRGRSFETEPGMVDNRLLKQIVKVAVDTAYEARWTPEAIWLRVAVDTANYKPPIAPTTVPDPDLFRAIVAIARRERGIGERYVLDLALREPLHVEPVLLERIVAHVQLGGWALEEIWESAWADRVAIGTPLPTPPDLALFRAIVYAAGVAKTRDPAVLFHGGNAQTILASAHAVLPPPDPRAPAVWPRYVATDLLKSIVFLAANSRTATVDEIREASLYLTALAGGTLDPIPDSDLFERLVHAAQMSPTADPRDILNRARAAQLTALLVAQQTAQEHSFGSGSRTLGIDPACDLPPEQCNPQPVGGTTGRCIPENCNVCSCSGGGCPCLVCPCGEPPPMGAPGPNTGTGGGLYPPGAIYPGTPDSHTPKVAAATEDPYYPGGWGSPKFDHSKAAPTFQKPPYPNYSPTFGGRQLPGSFQVGKTSDGSLKHAQFAIVKNGAAFYCVEWTGACYRLYGPPPYCVSSNCDARGPYYHVVPPYWSHHTLYEDRWKMWFDPTNYLGVPKWGVCSADEPGAPGELCDIDRGIIRGRSNDSVGLAFNPVTGEYRDGSGRFVEIPPGFTYNVRDEQWYDQFGHKIEWSDPDGMWISTASPNPSQGYGGEVIPFSNIPNPVAPALQKYANADAAGYFLVDKVWSLSQKYNVEMGGGIWQRPEDGTCYTRDILVGGPTGIDPGFVDEIRYEGKAAPGDKLVGWYHVHPEGHQNIGGEAFSAGDEGVSKGLGVPGYLGTPNGVFKVVYPNGTAKTVTLLPPTPADRVLEERLLDVLRRR